MKKPPSILCLVLLVSLSTEVSFSQSNQEDCDLLCQLGQSQSNQPETQTKKTKTPKKEVLSYKLVERQGVIYEVNSQTPFTGSSVDYYENGELQSRENYKDGEKDGLWEWFYKNGQLEERINYKDGKRNAVQK
jgi:antitoxin component YwqK of YwqJK toxin-antitoxin module